jgi:hypothetical protein
MTPAERSHKDVDLIAVLWMQKQQPSIAVEQVKLLGGLIPELVHDTADSYLTACRDEGVDITITPPWIVTLIALQIHGNTAEKPEWHPLCGTRVDHGDGCVDDVHVTLSDSTIHMHLTDQMHVNQTTKNAYSTGISW